MTTMTKANINKRKRNVSLRVSNSNLTILKSASSISLKQPLTKKIKKPRRNIQIPKLKDNDESTNKHYRFAYFSKNFLLTGSTLCTIIDDRCI